MPEFTITRQIDAPVAVVWEVLNDFGDIQRWNPGVKRSGLTSQGPVGEGSTRFCEFVPFGAVSERIAHHAHEERLTVHLYETSRLPISDAVADFILEERDGGTELTLHYSYALNLLGRMLRNYTAKQLEKGIGGLARSLQVESERIAAV